MFCFTNTTRLIQFDVVLMLLYSAQATIFWNGMAKYSRLVRVAHGYEIKGWHYNCRKKAGGICAQRKPIHSYLRFLLLLACYGVCFEAISMFASQFWLLRKNTVQSSVEPNNKIIESHSSECCFIRPLIK